MSEIIHDMSLIKIDCHIGGCKRCISPILSSIGPSLNSGVLRSHTCIYSTCRASITYLFLFFIHHHKNMKDGSSKISSIGNQKQSIFFT